jgi:peptidyl-prolyl cis-trans isomerase A (cyclophilin A)
MVAKIQIPLAPLSTVLLAAVFVMACRAAPPPGAVPARGPSAPDTTVALAQPEPAPAASDPVVAPEPPPSAPPSRAAGDALRNPALATAIAPERFTVLFKTTQGDLTLDVRRGWAPLGADRLYNLVKLGYFDHLAFFRVVPDFVAQLGIHGDPAINKIWRAQAIGDDAVMQSNVRGMVSFASSGKKSRTTQLFINLSDNPRLDALGFAPLGRVRELDVARKLYSGYGEGAPQGRGPVQQRIQDEGNAYLKAKFPKLDYVEQATITDEKPASRPSGT